MKLKQTTNLKAQHNNKLLFWEDKENKQRARLAKKKEKNSDKYN